MFRATRTKDSERCDVKASPALTNGYATFSTLQTPKEKIVISQLFNFFKKIQVKGDYGVDQNLTFLIVGQMDDRAP